MKNEAGENRGARPVSKTLAKVEEIIGGLRDRFDNLDRRLVLSDRRLVRLERLVAARAASQGPVPGDAATGPVTTQNIDTIYKGKPNEDHKERIIGRIFYGPGSRFRIETVELNELEKEGLKQSVAVWYGFDRLVKP